MADRTITSEMIEAAVRRIIKRLEHAAIEDLFCCNAEREQAIKIVREEVTALATGGAR